MERRVAAGWLKAEVWGGLVYPAGPGGGREGGIDRTGKGGEVGGWGGRRSGLAVGWAVGAGGRDRRPGRRRGPKVGDGGQVGSAPKVSDGAGDRESVREGGRESRERETERESHLGGAGGQRRGPEVALGDRRRRSATTTTHP
ncbi:glycine-rich cell wall structural protein 1.8-like [Capsicum annuum]|uniref:glycine-rich cell wall structural protein 1.8-like n=1 Tax=Capsicum annuum TaxID=4072 RepID=UPI001FB11DF7|nr:glycine-rich cell wall structural protein 1.8-like [Capsicum annuum]